MIPTLLLALTVTGAAAIVFFFLFVRSRAAGAEKKEMTFKWLHFAFLLIFTLIGIFALVMLAGKANY